MRAKIHNSGRLPAKNNDVLLITGDGRPFLSDLEAFSMLGVPYDLGCVGRCVYEAPQEPLHWFNADGETAMAWAKQLKEQNEGLVTHTLGEVDGFDVDWDLEQDDYHHEEMTNERGRLHGSSALFATLAGIAMGYDKIVLAGCPLDTEGHWYFEPNGPETLGPSWMGLDFMAWIDFSKQKEAEKVRSMSGYTEKLLGKASKSWLMS